jgi:aminopeptidase-like protein
MAMAMGVVDYRASHTSSLWFRWSVLFFWNTKARYVYSQIGSRIITFCSFGLIMLINFADN